MGGKTEELSWEIFKETLISQAEQGVEFYNTCWSEIVYIPLTVNRLTGIVSRVVL